MAKLTMCRMCLAQKVRMYVVVNKDLHELYGKLTKNPFVTEDRRPMLACFICCTQLKKCYRFQKKCLEAEEHFALMMNEEYERKPLIDQEQFELFHGFVKPPTQVINIVDAGLTESVVVKEELPAVTEQPDDIRSIIEKEDHLSDDDQEAVNYRFTVQNNCLNIEYVPRHQSESDDDVPLIEVKTEIEEGQEVTEERLTSELRSRSETASECESGAPGPSAKKKLRTGIVHKKCVTKYSGQDFKPSETQSTDNESRRSPKTSAERGREFRARKALLKQQSKQQQEPDAIVEIATEDIRSAGLSEEIRIMEKRARSAEATRRWREKKRLGVSESSKQQAKSAAQRMREYRERKKLAK